MSGRRPVDAGREEQARVDDPTDNRAGDAAAWSVPSSSGAVRAWALPESVPGGSEPNLVATELAGGPGVRAHLDALTRDEVAEAPPEPVPLGPLTTSDVLDGAWAVIKTRPKTVYALAAIIVLPIDVIAFFVMRSDLKVFSPWVQAFGAPFNPGGDGGAQLLQGVAATALLTLPATLLGACLAPLVVAWYSGRDLTVRDGLRAFGRRSPAVVGAYLWVGVFQLVALVGCFLGGIPTLLVTTMLLVTIPALMVENLGPLAASRRSLRLVNRRFMSTLWTVMLTALAEGIVYLALMLIPGVVSAFAPEGVQEVLTPVGSLFAQLVLAPVAPAVAVLLYLDLRVRSEGLDLDRDAALVFPAP